jgi:hypothetical protein
VAVLLQSLENLRVLTAIIPTLLCLNPLLSDELSNGAESVLVFKMMMNMRSPLEERALPHFAGFLFPAMTQTILEWMAGIEIFTASRECQLSVDSVLRGLRPLPADSGSKTFIQKMRNTLDMETTDQKTTILGILTRNYLYHGAIQVFWTIQTAQIALVLDMIKAQDERLGAIMATVQHANFVRINQDTLMFLVKDSSLLAILVFPCHGMLQLIQK